MNQIDDSEKRTPPGDDTVVRLLHFAGPRPEAPDDVLAEITQAARVAWRAKVEERRAVRRRRHRNTWLLAAAALLALGGTVYRVGFAPGPPVATVDAWFGSGGLAAGTSVTAGTELVTGAHSRAALTLASGTSLRLDRNTRVAVVAENVLELYGGAVYLDSGTEPSAAVEVRTPLGVARDVGTQFLVRRDDAGLRVQVREGEVRLELPSKRVDVPAGTAVTVREDGSVDREPTPAHGPVWEWVLAAAPSFELEGGTLDDYLHWLAREAGWELRFADPELEREAATIVTHGSITGIRPDATPDLVVVGSGLSYRLEEGVLVVER